MGTSSEWMWVAFSAIFWGGWMLLWGTSRKSDAHVNPDLSFLHVLGLILASFGFGFVMTFHWRAFHWPLILLTGSSYVGAAVLARSVRRKVRSAE